MNDEIELKSCPFCGCGIIGTAGHPAGSNSPHIEYAYYCTNCGAQGPNELNKNRAREMWNMRRTKLPKVVIPGSYKNAKGVLPWKEGDELPEVTVRRMRGGGS